MTRDNSEDALSWNVMRYLDKQGLLPEFLSKLSEKQITNPELILWSYSPTQESSWDMLKKARVEFGENFAKGTEPDIIIVTDKVLYFVEAKLKARNITTPRNLTNKKNYETGGGRFFKEVFNSDYNTVAITDGKYELMRLWLLGSWIAKELELDFEFFNLVKDSNEKNIVPEFGKHIISTNQRKFSRMTWEQIYTFIQTNPESKDKRTMVDYFKNKTLGYGSDCRLIEAFNL